MSVIADVCARAGGLQYSMMTGDTPTSQPPTPTVPGCLPSPALPSPALGLLPAAGEQVGTDGVLEQFEASALVQEAEDRLAQLMMDEELSDARLGGLDEGVTLLEGEGGLEEEEERVGGLGGVEAAGSNGVESRPSHMELRWGGEVSLTAGGGSLSVGEGTSYGTTQDPQESDRLDPGKTVAR